MLFTQTREDNPWPGQPRPSSRSALASKSTATCRPSSDPEAFAGCARRGGERVTLVLAPALVPQKKPRPSGAFFKAATPRLVSGEPRSQRPRRRPRWQALAQIRASFSQARDRDDTARRNHPSFVGISSPSLKSCKNKDWLAGVGGFELANLISKLDV